MTSRHTSHPLFLLAVLVASAVSLVYVIVSTTGQGPNSSGVVSVIPSGRTQLAQVADVTSGIVNWWKFDGTAADSQGSNSGTAVGTPSYVAGEIGQAISLNGSTDYVNIPGFTSLNGATQATVSFWAKIGSFVNGQGILSQWNSDRLFEIDEGASNSYTVYWRYGGTGGAGSTLSQATNNNSGTPGSWQLVTIVYNAGTSQVFLNGVLASTASGGGALNSSVADPLRIGWNNVPTFTNGQLDDVRIYNRALSSGEVLQVYQAATGGGGGGGTPPSTYTLTLTNSNTAGGTVTSNPVGINCGSTCSLANLAANSSVTLTATPGANFTTAWTGCSSSNGNSCTVNIGSANASVSVNFTSSGGGGGGCVTLPNGSYSTSFGATENPISQGCIWSNGATDGLDWHDVQTMPANLTPGSPAHAGGTMNANSSGYSDSTGILKGTFGPDQTLQATVYSINQTTTYWEEVELRMRTTVTPHSITGYEVMFSLRPSGSYCSIARWNGPLANSTNSNNGFTDLTSLPGNFGTSPCPVHDGDVVKATIVGNAIDAYVNGVKVIHAVDSTYTTGNPGIGFDVVAPPSVNNDYGFRDFSVTSSSGGGGTSAPTISGVSASGITTTGATINWTTNQAASSQVQYGLTTGYGSQTTADNTNVTSHSQILSGLTPNTVYNYTVLSGNANGNATSPGNFTFTTAAVSGGGATKNVPGTYATIQACANAAQPGDTCLVAAGNYNETVQTTNGGTAGNYVTFKANGAVTVKGFEIRAPYVEINGFTMTGVPASNIAYVLVMTGGSNCRLIGNTITNGTAPNYGIDWYTNTGQTPALNCTISGNTFNNLQNHGLTLDGSGHTVDHNIFVNMNGWDDIHVFGHDDHFNYNTFKDSAYLAGGNHADWLQTWGTNTTGAYNMTFDHNFIQNLTGGYQIGQIEGCEPSWLDTMTAAGTPVNNCDALNLVHDFTFTNNVFYNVSNTMNLDAPRFFFTNNTFLGNAYNSGAVIGFSPTNWFKGSGNGGIMRNNVFVGNGPTSDPSGQFGWYSNGGGVSGTGCQGSGCSPASITTDHNFVSGPAPTYVAKTQFPAEVVGGVTTSINGGDPKFQNVANPLGNDGIAFTSDDGLQPTTGSPLCGKGTGGTDIGAYPCSGVVQPPPSGTTYYVAKTGSDSNPGTSASPLLTIQACANKVVAGDTCLVNPGNYAEHVDLQTSSGVALAGQAGKPITFKAANAAVSLPIASAADSTMKGFRIRGPYVTVDGFDITKYDQASDQAYIRVESLASNCTISNNVIRNGIYRNSAHWKFNSNGTITTTDGGIIAAGFKAGQQVYISSDINVVIANHDTNTTITSVPDDNTLVVSGSLITDNGPTGTGVQSTIYQTATSHDGVTGITFVDTSQFGVPSGCTISGNILKDLGGRGMDLYGNNTTVTRNTWTNMNGWRMLSIYGNNNTFTYNVFRDSPRWVGFTPPLQQNNPPNSWDMFDTWIFSAPNSDLSVNNTLIEHNIVQNIDNEFSSVEFLNGITTGSGFIIRNNVFYNMQMSGSLHFPQTQVYNNTFVNSAPWSQHNFLVSDSSLGNPINSRIYNNVFVGNGVTPDPSGSNGWYSTLPGDMALPPSNDFVAGSYPSFPAKAGFGAEVVGGITTSINGGDPKFTSFANGTANPVGADGIPFTADDALQPAAGSPLCGRGLGGTDIGAYSCSGGGGGTTNPDTTAPTVSITSPTSGTITGSVQLTANATDPVIANQTTSGVNTVQFYLDSVTPANSIALLNTAPYQGSWNTVGVSNQAHTIIAVATDFANNQQTSSPVSITVNNPVPTFLLSLSTLGSGVGSVTSNVGGINCGATCSATVNQGTAVTLTATPVAGSTFTGWGGACSGTGTCLLTVNSATAVTATFNDTQAPSTPIGLSATAVSPTQINLSWSASTDNIGVTGYKIFRAGVLINTTSGVGTTYSDTGLNPNTAYSYTVAGIDAAANTGTQSSAAGATTQPLPTFSITVTNGGQGTVSSNPAGISCGSTCVSAFTSGASVVLTAAPNAGFTTTWAGCTTSNGNICNVTVNGAKAVTATFNDTQAPTVSLTAPLNNATVNGSVNVTATAADNLGVTSVQFRLDGADIGTARSTAPYTLTYDSTLSTNAAHTLTAVAKDAAGNSTTATTVTVTVNNVAAPGPDVTAPSVPTGLAATPISSSQINLVWSAATDPVVSGAVTSGVSGYRIIRNGTQLTTVSGTSYSDSGLVPNSIYTYKIASFDAATPTNVSAQSSAVSATTQAVSVNPAPVPSLGLPSGTLAVNTAAVTLSLATDIPATCKYSTAAGQAYSAMPSTFTVTGALAHSSVISGLSNGTAYTYYVRCQTTLGVAMSGDYIINFSVAAPFVAPPSNNGGGGGSNGAPASAGPSAVGIFTPTVPQKPANGIAQNTPTAACTPTASGLPTSASSLTIGSRGTAVTTLQSFLVTNGYLTSDLITGYFGPLTKAALAKYQAAHPTTSCAVQLTGKSRLASSFQFPTTLTTYTTSANVKNLQIFLNDHGYTVSVNGAGSYGNETTYYGPATIKALAKFQAANSISPAIGNFGPLTRGVVNQLLLAGK